MDIHQLATLSIIAVTSIISIVGFNRRSVYEKCIFSIGAILQRGQIYRLLTANFFHAGWTHLFFNMFSLYAFSTGVEKSYGSWVVLLIFFASAVGGDLIALILKRKNPRYRAVGASGGVVGIIFSSIFLLPGGSIYIIPLPVPIPAWAFAIGFMLLTLFGIGRESSDIGHEAHLGGALVGILFSIILIPSILFENYILLMAVALPAIIFLIYVSRRT